MTTQDNGQNKERMEVVVLCTGQPAESMVASLRAAGLVMLSFLQDGKGVAGVLSPGDFGAVLAVSGVTGLATGDAMPHSNLEMEAMVHAGRVLQASIQARETQAVKQGLVKMMASDEAMEMMPIPQRHQMTGMCQAAHKFTVISDLTVKRLNHEMRALYPDTLMIVERLIGGTHLP